MFKVIALASVSAVLFLALFTAILCSLYRMLYFGWLAATPLAEEQRSLAKWYSN